MKTNEMFADNFLNAYEGNNWTDVCIAETLADITIREATTQTPASVNTIAAIVNHLDYWNGVMMQRIAGNDPEVPPANGFDVAELSEENKWQQLITKLHQSFIELSDAMKNFSEDKLSNKTNKGSSDFYKNFDGITEHAYYHLGQIMILKKLIRINDSH